VPKTDAAEPELADIAARPPAEVAAAMLLYREFRRSL